MSTPEPTRSTNICTEFKQSFASGAPKSISTTRGSFIQYVRQNNGGLLGGMDLTQLCFSIFGTFRRNRGLPGLLLAPDGARCHQVRKSTLLGLLRMKSPQHAFKATHWRESGEALLDLLHGRPMDRGRNGVRLDRWRRIRGRQGVHLLFTTGARPIPHTSCEERVGRLHRAHAGRLARASRGSGRDAILDLSVERGRGVVLSPHRLPPDGRDTQP